MWALKATQRCSAHARYGFGLSAVEKANVRFIQLAYLLHCFAQIFRLRKSPRRFEIFGLEKKDDFIGIRNSPKEVYLSETCFDPLRGVSVVPALPFLEFPNLLSYKQKIWHRSSPLG